MVKAVLETGGFEVVCAADGKQALDYLTERAAPSVAVLDWMMPRLDGVSVCRELQKNPSTKGTFAILLTARGETRDIIEALEAGANDFITKPFRAGELLARLKVGERVVNLQAQLARAEKMEALGQVSAGLAHEINTPTQYAGDNVRFLQDAFRDIITVLAEYRRLKLAVTSGEDPSGAMAAVAKACQEADLDFYREEIPLALEQSLEGLARVSEIVGAVKGFSHPGEAERSLVDVNLGIENTLTLSRNEWKYVAEVETDLARDLPLIPAAAGELKQALLNIIVNAAQAIEERRRQEGSERKGLIKITTARAGQWVEIRVADDGCGIADEIREKVMEPFFTTKGVGLGTGQGLAITWSIVVERHRGELTFVSKVGQGTEFLVRLSVADPAPGGVAE